MVVLRAIGIGAIIFGLLQFSPMLMLKLQGVDLSSKQNWDEQTSRFFTIYTISYASHFLRFAMTK
jgi:hypothetical protein